MPDEPQPQRPTPGSVMVTILIFVVAGLLLVLFALPNNSPWFWPTLGGMVMLAGIALALPLRQQNKDG